MITIDPIPAFSDNYIWCLSNTQSGKAVVVDPGAASPVLAALAKKKLTLAGIMITHHHPDHVGGIDELLAESNVPVYGPINKQIPQITQALSDNDLITVLGIEFQVLTIPGHTLDHIAFYSDTPSNDPLLFCGDTLFAGGCGRIFEGTPSMMLASLSKLAQLPANTIIYCAHEYTLSNLTFALAVEPDNRTLKERIMVDTQRRQQGLATVPSILALEKQTNPFLRYDQGAVINAAEKRLNKSSVDELDVFTAIRQWKNTF